MTSRNRPLSGDFPACELRIDIEPSAKWLGSWWAVAWDGHRLGTSRDPTHLAARLLASAGCARPTDVLVLFLNGKEIARERVAGVMRRRAQKEPLASFWRKPEQIDKLTAAVLASGPPPEIDPADALIGFEFPADLQVPTDAFPPDFGAPDVKIDAPAVNLRAATRRVKDRWPAKQRAKDGGNL